MRVVTLLDIVLGYALLLLFAAALVMGVFKWGFFIAAAVLLLLYFVWDFLRLRCPWCRGPVEPSQLLRGLRRSCHCPSCGHEITVVTRVNRSVPRRRRSAPAAPPEDPTPRRRPELFDAEKENIHK